MGGVRKILRPQPSLSGACFSQPIRAQRRLTARLFEASRLDEKPYVGAGSRWAWEKGADSQPARCKREVKTL